MLLRNSAEVAGRPRRSTSTCRPSRCGSRPTRTRSGRSSGTSRPTACARCPTAARCCCRRRRETRRRASDARAVAVEDEGVGIPPEELDGIFQPFRGSFGKGTGLGLAIVHRIVTDYGGIDSGVVDGRQRHDGARAAAVRRTTSRRRRADARGPAEARRMSASVEPRPPARRRRRRERGRASRASWSSTTSSRCARCCASCCGATATRC